MSTRETMFWLLGILTASMIGLAFFKALDDRHEYLKEQAIKQQLDRIERAINAKDMH